MNAAADGGLSQGHKANRCAGSPIAEAVSPSQHSVPTVAGVHQLVTQKTAAVARSYDRPRVSSRLSSVHPA